MLLLVVTIAISLITIAAINIYADYLQNVFHLASKNFLFARFDFTLWGQMGILWSAWAALGALTVSYYLMLQHTRLGLALRALAEQPALA
jgi:branched-subunit amino acid ABC-type transport system permease component